MQPVIGQWRLTPDRSARLLPVTRPLHHLLLMLVLQYNQLRLVRSTNQLTVTQSVTSTTDNTMSSADGTTANPDSDSDLQAYFTSPVYPKEEDKVSDRETEIPEQDSDQLVFLEHGCTLLYGIGLGARH